MQKLQNNYSKVYLYMSESNYLSVIRRKLIDTIKYRRFKKCVINNKNIFENLTKYLFPPTNINIFDVEKSNEIHYEELKKVMIDKTTYELFNNLITLFYEFNGYDEQIAFQIDGRKALTAWMICAFPEYTLDKKKHELKDENIYPDEIFFISLEFLTNFHDLSNGNISNEKLRKFSKSLNKYSNAITYFLGRNKTEQLVKLTQEYYDINETMMQIKVSNKYTEENKRENELSLTKTKEKIYLFIKRLDPTIKKEDLETYANMNLLKSIKIEEAQYQIMLDDVKSKKLFYFRRAVDFIKGNLLKLGAMKTSTGHDISDILDGEFMARKYQMCSTYTNDEVNTYGDYIIKIINELQSPERENETNEKWNDMKNKNSPVHVHMVNMLFFSMKEIHNVFEQIQMMSTMQSVGINPFTLK